MFLKIILLTSLVTISSFATPTYPEEKKSNQALYSHSFNREDVPLSYQYSAVHVYSPKKKEEPKKILKNTDTAGIQFAPFPVQYEEQSQQNEAGLYTQVTYTKGYSETGVPEHSTEPTVKKNNLEPKLVSKKPALKGPAFNNQYIPGHNIQISQSSNRSPYNYRRIPQMEMQTMGHYLEPQRPSSTTYRPIVLEYLVPTTETPKISYTFVPKSQAMQMQMNFFTKGGKIPKVDHAGHVHPAKIPQLQLNIARDKFHQQQIRTAPAHISQARFYTYPLNQQIFVNPHSQRNPNDMTQLQPLPNHLYLSAYSRT